MSRAAMEPPKPAELLRLADVGLTEADPWPRHLCLRWATIDYSAGVLFASHLPIPWGAYWRCSSGCVRLAWTADIETALIVLDRFTVVQRGERSARRYDVQ
jgi:hypothetical protein